MPDDYYVSQYSGEEIDERLTAAHNAVRYDAAQTLTDEQKAQARTNIGADAVQGAVRYDTTQTLTDAQKTQARVNIGAANKETQDKVLATGVPSRTVTLTAAELQGYLDALPRMLTEALTIYISGTAAETLTIRDFYGPGRLQLEVLGGQSCTLSKGLLVKNCRIQIRVISVTITPNTAETSQFCVAAEEASYVCLGRCTIAGNGSSVGVNSRRDGLVLVEDCTVTNHKICAQAETGSRLCFSNTSGNGTYSGSQIGAYVWWGGMILLSEAAPELLGGTANSHSGGLIVKADGTVI